MKLINTTGFVVDQTTYPTIPSASNSWSRYVNTTGAPVDTNNDTYDFYVGKKTPGTHNQVKNPQGVIPEFHPLLVAALTLTAFVLLSRRRRRDGD